MIDLSVRKSLGAFQLAADLTCASDGITAIFGRSGAGKSTLINLIAGLMRPDSGHITIEGRQLFDSQKKIDIAPDKR
ncbi:MAG: ATP-binding cassette domain-containing protein, partial [Pseudomonadota bacterium]